MPNIQILTKKKIYQNLEKLDILELEGFICI